MAIKNFFNDDSLNDLDSRIDNIINSIPNQFVKSNSDDISGEFIDSFLSTTSQLSDINNLLSSVSIDKMRLDRYAIYDEAFKNVPIIKRIMKVYIASILQKNPITGQCVLVKKSEQLSSVDNDDQNTKIDESLKFAKEILSHFKITEKLKKKILPVALLYGDSYIEVVNINEESKKETDKDVKTSLEQLPLFESELNKMLTNNTTNSIHRLDQFESILEHISKSYVTYDETLCYDTTEFALMDQEEEKQKLKKSNVEEDFDFSNILFRVHKPHNVIVLETDFGTVLGYLIVSKSEQIQSFNITQSLNTLVGKVTNLASKESIPQGVIADKIVRFVVKQSLSKASEKKQLKTNVKNIDELLNGLDPTVFKYVKRLMIEQDLLHKNQGLNHLKVRFVPSNKMVAFTIPSAEYDPYGESFVDSLIFPCKLFIISQLSNVITKLSRAAPVRKLSICAH